MHRSRLPALSRERRASATLVACAALIACAALASSCASRHPDARTAAETALHARYFGSTTPPKDNVFRFNNGAEPETYDPGIAVGQPDGRAARILFEGLTIPDPQTLEPRPAQASRWELSADGLTYTFHLRPGLQWSDGAPLTANDFLWSWMRVLRPSNAGRYASLMYPIDHAEEYNKGHADSSSVGLSAPDDTTFIVRLASPTPYFVFLTQFYTFCPTPRFAIEQYGDQWTRPGKIVSNGAYVLSEWRQQDRFVFTKNPRYWDAANVKLDRIEAYSVDDLNTSVNLYKSGAIAWTTSGYIPSTFIPYLRDFKDYQHGAYQGTYFYSINVTRKPLDNVWVRRALNWSIDRVSITRDLLKRSREPWGDFCPSGYPGYTPPPQIGFDPVKAREYLAKGGFPGGKGFPKISIMFNSSEDHKRLAEAIQQMWKRYLNIDIELSNQEWGSFLQATTAVQYDIARRSWIGDYLDPTTFLGCMMTGDGNNRAHYSNPRYDQLLHQAARELVPAKRLAMLSEAEKILLDDSAVLPVYQYSVNDLVKPYVHGIWPTALDTHPLAHVYIDREWEQHLAPVAGMGARVTPGPSARLAAIAGRFPIEETP